MSGPGCIVCTAVRYVLNGGNYPFMALAMLKQARMSLIGRFEGGCGQHWCRLGVLLMKECPLSGLLPEELFLQNLVDILDRHEPELVVSRNERYWVVCVCVHSVCVHVCICMCVYICHREDRQLSQLLRQQQENAFQQSLKADQEKVNTLNVCPSPSCDHVPLPSHCDHVPLPLSHSSGGAEESRSRGGEAPLLAGGGETQGGCG